MMLMNSWLKSIDRSNCDSEAADALRGYYSRPYFLPPLSESSRTDWIFIGTPGLGAHMHVRPFMYNNNIT